MSMENIDRIMILKTLLGILTLSTLIIYHRLTIINYSYTLLKIIKKFSIRYNKKNQMYFTNNTIRCK